jgi:nitrate/nitrite transport system substrate-binding protein
VEKAQLTIGFIKLTDMVPLAIAYEKGYFEDEGLFVTLEPQANWKVLLDRVIDGELDGAHMLAGQPIAATIGFGTKADVITAFSMDLNGNAITVSNEVWAQMQPHVTMEAEGRPAHPIKADALKPVVDAFKADGRRFKMGMVFPVSTHNYELRYWLAAGGLHPGLLLTHRRVRADRRGRAALGDAAAADAGHARGGHDQRVLRRRAVEPAGDLQGHRRAGDHRL